MSVDEPAGERGHGERSMVHCIHQHSVEVTEELIDGRPERACERPKRGEDSDRSIIVTEGTRERVHKVA